MHPTKIVVAGLAGALLLQGCAATPTNPTVAVLPGPGKPFDAFQADQAVCKQYAAAQVAGQAEHANALGVGGALLGTALGAGLGGAIGGGYGAGVGAASGAIVGTAGGGSYTSSAQYSIQQQYDIAYEQCQYSKGNQIPGYPGAPVAAYPGYYPPPGYPPPSPGY